MIKLREITNHITITEKLLYDRESSGSVLDFCSACELMQLINIWCWNFTTLKNLRCYASYAWRCLDYRILLAEKQVFGFIRNLPVTCGRRIALYRPQSDDDGVSVPPGWRTSKALQCDV